MEIPLRILAIIGTLQRNSISSVVIGHVAVALREADCVVDIVDFKKEPLSLFDPDTAHRLPGHAELQARIDRPTLSFWRPLTIMGASAARRKISSTISGESLPANCLLPLSLRLKRD